MRWWLFLVALAAGLSTGGIVLAVGSGTGTSAPACSADTWRCTDWSACTSAATQTRTCSLTFDCPTATTPRPAESQSCAAPAANPPIANANLSIPQCPNDAWRCDDWSACDTNGQQTRRCTVRSDCANPPAEPERFRACAQLQCGQLATTRERVVCRLNLSPAGIARELQIQYLPEACRDRTGQARDECIEYYRAYQPCWQADGIAPRLACARNVLKLGPVMAEEVKTCRAKTGPDQAACKQALKDKVYDLIKFRFYELEQRAESLGDLGVDLNIIADFIVTVEGKKLEFDAAPTTAARRQVILDVRQAWNAFIQSARTQLK